MKATIHYIKSYEIKDDREYMEIYDHATKSIRKFDKAMSKNIDVSLKLAHFNEWSRKIIFDTQWVCLVESKFLSILDIPKNRKFFEFLSKTFDKRKIANELTQIFVQFLKRSYMEVKKVGLESSWFYIEFGRLLSSFFIKNAYHVDELKLEKIVLFLQKKKPSSKNLKAFFDDDLEIVNFFNETFAENFDKGFSNIIEHFLTIHFTKKTKDYEINVDYFNKLNIQYVQYSANFINDILKEYFEFDNIKDNNKTYKVFIPKGMKKIPVVYNISKNLPSVSLESFDETARLKYYEVNNVFDIFCVYDNNYIHQSTNLNSSLTSEYLTILKKLKNMNSFKINIEMLVYLVNVFTQKLKNSIVELYGVDLTKIFNKSKFLDSVEEWSLDLNNLEKFKPTIRNRYLNSALNTIYSKKLHIYEIIKQSCTMVCFEKFYFDWFSDSRGRIYCSQSGLNLQGSNVSKLLVSLYKDTKLSSKNECFLMETLSNYYNKNENIINPLKESNHYLLNYELERKIINSSYALDASSSGLQMLSIILKNKNLGMKCGLLKSDEFIDLYTRVSQYLKNCVDKNTILMKKINKIPGLYDLIQTRKFSKLPIMTIPYNSTTFGRIDQMLETLIDYCFLKGFKLKNNHFNKLNNILFELDSLLIEWCKKEIPECFDFIHTVRKFIFEPKFNNEYISNGFCKFNYKMVLKSVSRRKIGIKFRKNATTTKISVFILKKYENVSKIEKFKIKSKINNSFIANLIHNIDARIATNLVKKCIDENINFYTIHDCFRIEYDYAWLLRDLICKEYFKLFDYDYLKSNNIPRGSCVADLNLQEFTQNLNKKFFVKV